jgi:hypothetical protein
LSGEEIIEENLEWDLVNKVDNGKKKGRKLFLPPEFEIIYNYSLFG